MSNHTGRLLNTVGEISRDLWISVAMTVRWYDGTSLLYELGTRIFIEMEPAGVLSKIAQSSFPDATVLAMQKDNLDAITWLWNSYLEE
jgi:malonate decarboxylase epsilon subunit